VFLHSTSKHYRYSSACAGDYVDRSGSTVAGEIKEFGLGASVRERRQKLLDAARRRNIGANSFIEELVSTVK
jgi:hypothetical protein